MKNWTGEHLGEGMIVKQRNISPLTIKNFDSVGLLCPFCHKEIEFELNESIEAIGLIYNCLFCKKKFHITKSEK